MSTNTIQRPPARQHALKPSIERDRLAVQIPSDPPKTRRSRENLAQYAPSLTTLLLLALLVTTLIGFVLFGPKLFGGKVVRELTLETFDGQLTSIEVRTPSLFGTVDRSRWVSLDQAARLELVDQVSRVLSENGFSGALLRTEDGVPVAQWLEQRGPMLLENRELP